MICVPIFVQIWFQVILHKREQFILKRNARINIEITLVLPTCRPPHTSQVPWRETAIPLSYTTVFGIMSCNGNLTGHTDILSRCQEKMSTDHIFIFTITKQIYFIRYLPSQSWLMWLCLLCPTVLLAFSKPWLGTFPETENFSIIFCLIGLLLAWCGLFLKDFYSLLNYEGIFKPYLPLYK